MIPSVGGKIVCVEHLQLAFCSGSTGCILTNTTHAVKIVEAFVAGGISASQAHTQLNQVKRLGGWEEQ